MSRPTNREIVERYMRAIPAEFDTLRELQHPDFVEEFPQSGEVIRGRDNFRAIQEHYVDTRSETRRVTGTEDRWTMAAGFPHFAPVRVEGAGDMFTAESVGTYPDGSVYHAVAIIEMRDGKILHVRTYFAAPFEAPEWRAPWVEPSAGPT